MSEAMKSVIIGLHRQGNKPEKISELLRLDVLDIKRVISEYPKLEGTWKITT